MNEHTINGSIRLQCPDGFRTMDTEDLKKAYLDDNADRWGMIDEGSHMIFCVYWHKNNRLLAALADAKTVCKNTEANLSKMLENRDYKLRGFRDITVDGRKCTGFRHKYTLQDIPYVSDVVVMKVKDTFYTFYSYTREECEEANRPVLEGILQSVKVL